MAEYVGRLVWRGVTLIPREDGRTHFRFAYWRQDGPPPPRSYDAATARAELIAALCSVLEREGIDPDDPLPAVWQMKEISVAFMVAEYLDALRALEAACSQGADMEEIGDIREEIGVLRERMFWTGLKDPELGRTVEQLAQVGRNTIPGRRKGGKGNAEKAKELAALIRCQARLIRARNPEIRQGQLGNAIRMTWPRHYTYRRPATRTIQRALAGMKFGPTIVNN
jgi:hypothetical protein